MASSASAAGLWLKPPINAMTAIRQIVLENLIAVPLCVIVVPLCAPTPSVRSLCNRQGRRTMADVRGLAGTIVPALGTLVHRHAGSRLLGSIREYESLFPIQSCPEVARWRGRHAADRHAGCRHLGGQRDRKRGRPSRRTRDRAFRGQLCLAAPAVVG